MSNDYIQEDTRLINLYSQDANSLNGSLKSNLEFNFTSLLNEEDDIIYTTIGISTAQFPSSFYTINEYKNTLRTTFGTLNITFGNYNSSSLITELTAQFLTLPYYLPMTITISKINGRLSFIHEAGGFDFLSSGSTAFDILGFDPKVRFYNSQSIGGVRQEIVAPFPCNLLGIQQLRINSNAFSSFNSNSTNLGESQLIAVIQNNAPPFGMITYNNQNSYSVLRNKRISMIDIQILDEDDNFLDFNGVDHSMTFQMTIYRRVSLPDNSTAYLRPILATLTTIQEDLANNPKSKSSKESEPEPEKDLVESPEIFNNDENSLDVMLYNNQFSA